MLFLKIETGCWESIANNNHRKNGMDNGDILRKVLFFAIVGFSPERTGIKPSIDDKIKQLE